MAKLTTKRRKALPSSMFALPGDRKFPIPDRSHAANAKARASQGVKAGTLTSSEKATIDRKADKVLNKGKSSATIMKEKMLKGRK